MVRVSVTLMCRRPVRGSVSANVSTTPFLTYSPSTSRGWFGLISIGLVTSPASCLLDSSMQATGNSALYGRWHTSSTSSMRATNSPLSSGGIFQYLPR